MSKKDPQERADVFIAQYQSSYSEAIDEARRAAETTATSAWQSRFATCIKQHKELIAEHMREIKMALEVMRTQDTDEGTEKEIKDAVKGIAEERIRHSAWWTRAVMPYQNAAERCESLISKCLSDAREAEQRAPLVDRGLAEAIRERVKGWPRAKWDEEAGVVNINEDGQAQSHAA